MKKIRKDMHRRAGYYRISNVAERIDRTPMTILRWEKVGLIPKAKRDSRGWRMYSESDVVSIVNLVEQTNYFRRE